MSDKTRSKQTLFTVFGLIALAIISLQAWYMFDMKQKLDHLSEQTLTASSAQAVVSNKPPVPSAKSDTSRKIADNPVQATSHSSSTAPGNTNSTTGSGVSTAPNTNQNTQPQAPLAVAPLDPFFDRDPFSQHPFSQDPFFRADNWNPYEEIQRMQRDMDRIFNQTFQRFNRDPAFQQFFSQHTNLPEMDIKETDHDYIVTVNLPGSSEDNISVTIKDNILTIRSEQDSQTKNTDQMGNILFQERHTGVFQRSISLPGEVDQNGMQSHVDNGVLTITLPKA